MTTPYFTLAPGMPDRQPEQPVTAGDAEKIFTAGTESVCIGPLSFANAVHRCRLGDDGLARICGIAIGTLNDSV